MEKILEYLKAQIGEKYWIVEDNIGMQELHEAYCVGREALALHEVYLKFGGQAISRDLVVERKRLAALEIALHLPRTLASQLDDETLLIVTGSSHKKVKTD